MRDGKVMKSGELGCGGVERLLGCYGVEKTQGGKEQTGGVAGCGIRAWELSVCRQIFSGTFTYPRGLRPRERL